MLLYPFLIAICFIILNLFPKSIGDIGAVVILVLFWFVVVQYELRIKKKNTYGEDMHKYTPLPCFL